MKQKYFSMFYDLFMIFVIFLSLLPLIVPYETPIFQGLDQAVVFVFGLDYLMQAWWNYRYCLSPIGVVDFLSIIPALPWIRVLKLARFIRAVRALKLFRFWRDTLLFRVIQKQKTALLLVWSMAVCYVFMIAVLMYCAERSAFTDFFEALYYSVMTLTSVGYGDVVPETRIGRLIIILSIWVGTALIALPSGIIAAGYVTELGKTDEIR